MAGSITIAKARLLLVEGTDDLKFFGFLLEHLGISNIQVVEYGGKNNFRNFIRTLQQVPKFENVFSLAVVRDANGDANSARQSVEHALSDAQLWSPGNGGTGPDSTLPVSVLIMPPGRSDGCLETLLWETISAGVNSACIEDYIGCVEIPPEGTRYAKAKIHTYLAAQPKPGLKIGESLASRYWDVNHSAFDPVKDFLRELAG